MSVFLSTVTTKGRTTVPEPIRCALGLEAGSRIVWELQDPDQGGEPQIVVRSRRSFSELAGSLSSKVPFLGIEEENKAVRTTRTAHVVHKHRLK